MKTEKLILGVGESHSLESMCSGLQRIPKSVWQRSGGSGMCDLFTLA